MSSPLIVEGLALQLEQVYRRATSAGASDEEARADVDAEVTDWDALAQTLLPRPRRGVEPERARGDSLVSALLFGVSPRDPLVFATVGALVLLSAFGACLPPLARALRTSPIVAIRGN